MKQETLKRAMDVTLSSLALIALSPVFAIIAVLVLIDSGPPVLFHHNRVGRGFRPISVLKFRTMRANNSGPGITIAGDSRITKVGKWLRLTKLDELPQLWNVLRGDMALVGPRPEVPEYVERFETRYREVLRIRPGITDLASIHFRHEERLLAASSNPQEEYVSSVLPAKLELAEQYLRTWTLQGDFALLLKTMLATIRTR